MARFYRHDLLGDSTNPDFCFTTEMPTEVPTNCLVEGQKTTEWSSHGYGEVVWGMDPDYEGLVLGSFIGNTEGLLACSREFADVVLAHDAGEVEVIPFVLLNHRKRVHSRDYVFLNPLGTRDVLNPALCEIDRTSSGKIASIAKYVFDSRKLEQARDLFRVPEDPGEYFYSEKLVNALRAQNFTNLVLEEIDVV